MMSCRRATELTAIAMTRPLGVGEFLSLKFHRLVCISCRRYAQQSEEIHRAAGEMLSRDEAPEPGLPMPTSVRERIANRLDRHPSE